MNQSQTNAEATARPFTFARLERRTGDYLVQIREQAARIAEEAKEEIARYRQEAEAELAETERRNEIERRELERLRTELDRREQALSEAAFQTERQKGFEAGWTEGEKSGYEQGTARAKTEMESNLKEETQRRLDELTGSIRPAVAALSEQLGRTRRSLLERWETNVLQIAAAIAHQAIARELERMPELPLALLRESLELAVGCTAVKIRMNPDDLAALKPRVDALLTEFAALTRVETAADERIAPGGCVVETSQGIIDQRIETRLERIIAELSNE